MDAGADGKLLDGMTQVELLHVIDQNAEDEMTELRKLGWGGMTNLDKEVGAETARLLQLDAGDRRLWLISAMSLLMLDSSELVRVSPLCVY